MEEADRRERCRQMNRYHGMLMAVLGFAFLMGWNGVAGAIVLFAGLFLFLR